MFETRCTLFALTCLTLLAPRVDAQKGRVDGGPGAGPFFDPPQHDRPDYGPARGNPYVLAFAGGSMAPEPGIDPRLRRVRSASVWCYLMLEGRIGDRQKLATLRRLGVVLRKPHTWQCWSAKIPTANLGRIAALPFVRWVGWPKPEQKVHPRLRRRLARADAEQRVPIAISIFESDIDENAKRVRVGKDARGERFVQYSYERVIPNGAARKRLQAKGFGFVSYAEMGRTIVFRGTATTKEILSIVELPFVEAVDVVLRPVSTSRRLPNDQSMSMIGQDAIRPFFSGGSVTVGVVDSGVYAPSLVQTHQDLQNKHWLTMDVTGQGALLDLDGHGTHVTGTFCGEGLADVRYLGAAPTLGKQASNSLWIGRYLNNNGATTSNDIAQIFLWMAADDPATGTERPRLINCSWAAFEGDGYIGSDEGSTGFDDWVWENNQLPVFGAGNDSDENCWIPAVAKNVLTVGACRTDPSVGVNAGDLASDTCGGTGDGRRKPEVLAPGQIIRSCGIATPSTYVGDTGTSMAAPHVSGALASLIEHYPQYFDYRPALLKAHACASAEWQGKAGFIGGWHGEREGYGVIDAIKMHGSGRTTWRVGNSSLDQAGEWTSWDWDVPQDVEHAKLVLAWIEPACAVGATAAVVNDLKLVIDLPPYSAAGDAGDYVASVPGSNVVSLAGKAIAQQMAGKTVRIKVYADNMPTEVRLGVSLMLMTADPDGTTGLGMTLSKDVIKPNEQTMAQVTLLAGANTHHFENARIEPANSTLGWEINGMFRTTADGILQAYTNPVEIEPSFSNGMTLGLGLIRRLDFRLVGKDEGVWPVKMRALYDPNDLNKTVTKSLCVDGSPPDDFTGVGSNTHTPQIWSSQSLVTMHWNQARDRGCGGIGGLGWIVSQGAPAKPRRLNLAADATRVEARLPSSSGSLYLNVHSVDRAGNASRTASFGPLLIDAVAPGLKSITLNGGAQTTTSSVVRVDLVARDRHSGLADVRFSANGGQTWNAWSQWDAGFVMLDVAGLDGGAGTGTKTVHAEVRDRAHNVSERRSASIIVLR